MDFGYSWLMTYTHLLLAAPAALAAAWLARRRRARRIKWLLVILSVWATAAFLVVKFGFRLDAPVKPPTSRFLGSGEGKVLDLGCGSGRFSIGLLLSRPRATVVGLDNWSADYIRGNGSDLLLANAKAAGVGDRISPRSADMRALPFEDGSFDAVVSAYAIDHLDAEGIVVALAEAARVLRPGGELLILNMNRDAWAIFAYTPLYGLHSSGASLALHGGASHPPVSPDAHWRARLEHVGLEVLEVGRRPGTLYYLARKPVGPEPHS